MYKDCSKFVSNVSDFIEKIKLPQIDKKIIDAYFNYLYYHVDNPKYIDIEYEVYLFYSYHKKWSYLLADDPKLKASQWVEIILVNSNKY